MDINNEEKIGKNIKDGLDFLDNSMKVDKPDLSYFRELVSEVEEKKQVKRTNQFFVFLLLAAAILGIEGYTLFKSINAFIMFQIAAIMLLPVGLVYWFRHYRRKVNSQ